MLHPDKLKQHRIITGLFLILIIVTMGISMSVGYASLSFDRLIPVFMGRGHSRKNLFCFLSDCPA